MDRPLLVLLHGWGANARVWADTVQRLGSRFEILTPELPGHGNSALTPGEIGETALAIGTLVDRPAHWLGWSLGALLAMQAASSVSEKVLSLSLVSATPAFIQAGDWQTAMPADEFDRFQSDFDKDAVRTLGRFMALQAQGDTYARPVLRQLKAVDAGQTHDPRRMGWGLDLLRSTDLREQLADFPRSISPSIHILHGSNDRVVPVGAGKYIAGATGSEIEVWDDIGHVPFLSQPGRFADWLGRTMA